MMYSILSIEDYEFSLFSSLNLPIFNSQVLQLETLNLLIHLNCHACDPLILFSHLLILENPLKLEICLGINLNPLNFYLFLRSATLSIPLILCFAFMFNVSSIELEPL